MISNRPPPPKPGKPPGQVTEHMWQVEGFTVIQAPGLTVIAVPMASRIYDAVEIARRQSRPLDVVAVALAGYVVLPELTDAFALNGVVVAEGAVDSSALEVAEAFARQFRARREDALKHLEEFNAGTGDAG